jgi:hypothetical protein
MLMDLMWPSGWFSTLILLNALVGGMIFNYLWFVTLKRHH